MKRNERNVSIRKEKFKELFRIRGTSEKRFGLLLEEKGIISYRQLQRNLKDGTMNPLVLEKCSQLLDCHPTYLEGKLDFDYKRDVEGQGFESFEDYMGLAKQFGITIDSEGIIVNHYETYPFSKNHMKRKEYLLPWLKSLSMNRRLYKKEVLDNLDNLIDYEELYNDIEWYAVDKTRELLALAGIEEVQE